VGYQWQNKLKTFTSSEASPFVNPTESDSYFVTITDVNGCVKKDTVNVRVVPGIDLKFKAERINHDCFGIPSLRLINQTDPNENVFFDFGDGYTSDLPNVVYQYQQGGKYIIRIVGRKEACVYDKQEIVQIDSLKIPNVITPAVLDGKNDTFQVQYGNSRQSIKVSMAIYNRWGSLVYESMDYKDDWSGSEVAAGIYYYDAVIEGITACKGWVQVMK
jgi:gliding motility-associated-like protein